MLLLWQACCVSPFLPQQQRAVRRGHRSPPAAEHRGSSWQQNLPLGAALCNIVVMASLDKAFKETSVKKVMALRWRGSAARASGCSSPR